MGASRNTLGMGIGSFFSAFTQSRNEKDARAERDKAAKLSGQLLEIQLKQLQEQEAAFGRLEERVNAPTELEAAPSKFTEGGRELTQFQFASQPGLAELISDPSALLDLVRSGQVDIGELLKEQGVAGRATQRQENLDKFFGSGFNNPTDAAGNPQFIFAPGIGANGEITATPSLNQAYQLPQAEQLEQNEITTTFERVQASVQRNMQLAQSQPLQATGSPFAGAGSLFGRGSEAVSGLFGVQNPFAGAATAAAMQKALEKDFAVAMFTSAELDTLLKQGRITLAQWNQLKTSNPDINNPWPVNTKIQLDSLELKLNNNDVLGINVSNEKEVRDYIKTMREVIRPELELLGEQAGPGFISQAAGGARNIASQVGGFAERTGNLAGDLASQAGGFADQAVSAVTPIVGRAIETAKQFASASLDKLQNTDFRALAEDAQQSAHRRWDQLVDKLPLEEIEAMDLKGKTQAQLQSIQQRWDALQEPVEQKPKKKRGFND